MEKDSGSPDAKRQKVETVGSLIFHRQWDEAIARVKQHPEEAKPASDPSPLALACRLGAPVSCVKAVLEACPDRLRHMVDSRGTPLHEAIVCENVGVDVIKALLEADEAMGTGTTRAALSQDVDGFTPLHVLIRRRFQSYILSDDGLIQILEMLVKSCAQAVVVPDMGEYEEPPIVYALKANLYAPLLGSEDATTARVERRIYEMVACMLQHYPEAACCVFAGYRGQYTAVHSAVFHGRSPHTLELLLKAEARTNQPSKACMLANTQGEMPLHFCTMRGEPPQSVALLARAAPAAVHTRDASGLMPTHWLWVRFVSSLVVLEEGGRGSDDSFTIDLPPHKKGRNVSTYTAFACFEQGNLEADLLAIRRLDPSVDFLRMRHIPMEVLGEEDSLRWASRTSEILSHVRSRHEERCERGEGENKSIVWTRKEAVASLFWTKLVSLLEASREVGDRQPMGDKVLVHTAFANACFLPAVCRLTATLYPEELETQDEFGCLPLHYAAGRPLHNLDWPPEGEVDARPSRLFHMETLDSLRTAMEMSDDAAASVLDNAGRLPLHHMVETYVRASSRHAHSKPIKDMIELMKAMVRLYPDALQRRDGRTKLIPCLEATAIATEECAQGATFSPELHLSIPYILLREDPTLIQPSGDE